MSYSIVKQLGRWLLSRTPRLVSAGIDITDRIPEPSSNVPWKGTIGLVKNDVLVSFTVWERTIFQTELIVVEGASGEMLLSEDGNPGRAEEIDSILDSVVDDLITGKYTCI